MKKKDRFKSVCRYGALLAVGFISCDRSTPILSLNLEEVYYLPRMTGFQFQPGYTGQEYKWSLRLPDGRDSLLSTERYYTFVQKDEGIYDLTFRIIDPDHPYEFSFQVCVVHELVEFSPYISRVLEYRPGPGQFVNELPQYEQGDTEETMRRKVEQNLSGTNDRLVTLGAYGGYIVFGFDHTVMNVNGAYDFSILGNAFYDLIEQDKRGGSCEPGIVKVAFDKNQNGIPDEDEWYELAGSEYYKPETIKNYEITYYRASADKIPEPDASGQITDQTYIRWTDNQGETGYIEKNEYHSQDYYPQWIAQDELTFRGTRLQDNAQDLSGFGSYFVLYAYDWGYADNHPNDSVSLISFDINWAVDKEGKPVYLPGIDFVKVYTAVNQTCGRIGETSTEIVRAQDLHLLEDKETSVPPPLPDKDE